MVCAAVAVIHPSKVISSVVAESRMVSCSGSKGNSGTGYKKERRRMGLVDRAGIDLLIA